MQTAKQRAYVVSNKRRSAKLAVAVRGCACALPSRPHRADSLVPTCGIHTRALEAQTGCALHAARNGRHAS